MEQGYIIVDYSENQHSHFLDEMFESLKANTKNGSDLPSIPKDTKYKGFKTIPIQTLQPRKLYKDPPMDGRKLWKKDLVQTMYCYQQSCHLSYRDKNGFFKAFYDAYIEHGDVKITPDDVWLTIMLYFSQYVNKNAQQLRKAFVHHEGKKELVIETKQKDEQKWQEFFQKIIVQIRQKSVKGVTQQLECNFTSTDNFSKILSTAMVMNAYQKYYDYTRMICICGIQNVHMGGQLEDWLKIVSKLQFLEQFDVDGKLKIYIKRLVPVLQQFVQTYKGNPSTWFWNNISNKRDPNPTVDYGVFYYVNGWIIRFFTTDDELGLEIDGLHCEEIDVPIKLVNLITNTIKDLNLVGGCLGVSVEDQNVYRPHFSFAIVQKGKQPEYNEQA